MKNEKNLPKFTKKCKKNEKNGRNGIYVNLRRVQTVMNVQHGGFKFFVIFIVTWTILSDQKKF